MAAEIRIKRPDTTQGLLIRGPVVTLGGKGWLWAYVSFQVGEREVYGQDIAVQWATIRDLVKQLEQLRETEEEGWIRSGIESPELNIEIKQCWIEPDLRDESEEEFYYRLWVNVDTSIGAGAQGVTGTGPGVMLWPGKNELFAFVYELLIDARMAMQEGQGSRWGRLHA